MVLFLCWQVNADPFKFMQSESATTVFWLP